MAFAYRIKRTYPALEGVSSPSTRYTPQVSNDGGTSYEDLYDGDQPQTLAQAQDRLAESTSSTAVLIQALQSGRLGTLHDFVAYP